MCKSAWNLLNLTRLSFFSRFVLISILSVITACGGGGGNNNNQSGGDTAAPALEVVLTPGVFGRVVSTSTGSAIAGAQVTINGSSKTTDANGDYAFENLIVNDQALITVTATGFAPTTQVAVKNTTQRITVNVSMVPNAISGQIDPTLGGTVSDPASAVQVELPANGLERTDGNPISGNIIVELTPIPAAVNSSWMPGSYTAMQSGQSVPVETFGAITVLLKDNLGAQVNLASGETATIRIPVSSRFATAPATIALFYYDGTTNSWVEEGTATLVGSGGGAYYEGTVSHFTTWMAGQYLTAIQVTGCVVDAAGARVASAIITTDGIDYSSKAIARTDNSGNFSLPIRALGKATVVAQADSRISNTRDVGPFAANTNITSSCLALSGNEGGVNIKLTWGESPNDIDSHVYTPSGTHVYFGNRGTLSNAPYLNLDVDDITSYGPEVITFNRLEVGTYKYYVHNYSETFAPGITGSLTRVELTVNTFSELYSPPANEGGNRWWHVFNLTVAANCDITITPVGAWSDTEPTATAGTPTYCAWVGSTPATTPNPIPPRPRPVIDEGLFQGG